MDVQVNERLTEHALTPDSESSGQIFERKSKRDDTPASNVTEIPMTVEGVMDVEPANLIENDEFKLDFGPSMVLMILQNVLLQVNEFLHAQRRQILMSEP